MENLLVKLGKMVCTVFRYRSWFLFGGAALAMYFSLKSDPDGGMSTLLGGLALIQGVWAVAAAHFSRKALMDYIEADQRKLFTKSLEGATGAGLALIAMAITFVGLLMVFSPRAHADNLPEGFIKYGHVLKTEQQRYWPDHPDSVVLAGLVEQESCISLRSHGCWNPSARLKTSREEGAGMGQLTRAYRTDGSMRFDALASVREQYITELGAMNWENIYTRPDLQMRTIVMMSRDAARPFRTTPDMLAFGDAAYNGGVGGVQNERRACALNRRCDPGRWIGHVELHCLKSRQSLYGGRNACDINREHVKYAIYVRPVKYRAAWAAL